MASGPTVLLIAHDMRGGQTIPHCLLCSMFRRDVCCNMSSTSHCPYLLLSTDPLRVPGLVVGRVTNSTVAYRVQRNDDITDAVITGYNVVQFGVPMIGECENEGSAILWLTATINPAVPGAQYRITAWALGGGRRSRISTINVTTSEASESK